MKQDHMMENGERLLWEGKPLFPKATLHIAKEELDVWKEENN